MAVFASLLAGRTAVGVLKAIAPWALLVLALGAVVAVWKVQEWRLDAAQADADQARGERDAARALAAQRQQQIVAGQYRLRASRAARVDAQAHRERFGARVAGAANESGAVKAWLDGAMPGRLFDELRNIRPAHMSTDTAGAARSAADPDAPAPGRSLAPPTARIHQGAAPSD